MGGVGKDPTTSSPHPPFPAGTAPLERELRRDQLRQEKPGKKTGGQN